MPFSWLEGALSVEDLLVGQSIIDRDSRYLDLRTCMAISPIALVRLDFEVEVSSKR